MGYDPAQNKMNMAKVVATITIVAQAQQLTAQTKGQKLATSHMALSMKRIFQAYGHIFMLSSPICICSSINYIKLNRAYIFPKPEWM